MNFLLDENIPSNFITFLKKYGHQVLTLQELNQRGVVNGEVGRTALKLGAIIITFDSDFLHLKKEIQKHSRIIYLKMKVMNPQVMQDLLEQYFDQILQFLENPGMILISQTECILKRPFES